MPAPTIAIRGVEPAARATRANAAGPATASAPIAPPRFRNSRREYAASARRSRSSTGEIPSRSASPCSFARRSIERNSGVRAISPPIPDFAREDRGWRTRLQGRENRRLLLVALLDEADAAFRAGRGRRALPEGRQKD